MHDVTFHCCCGQVTAKLRGVAPERVNRVVCYCTGCQAYAHFLGRAEAMLDRHGGSDIFQPSPACLSIEAGFEQVACVRLTPKGALRWYAACCNTPLGNTLASGRVPFLGMFAAVLPIDEQDRDGHLGRVRARINGQAAIGDQSTWPPFDKAPLAMLFRFAGKLLGWRLRGAHRRSPFFDPASGKPRVAIRQLSAAEYEAITR